MSSVVTRILSGQDIFDLVPIKVDPEFYKDKWGIIEVTVTSYSWGAGTGSVDAGKIDLRSAQFNQNNDTPLLNNVPLITSGGSQTLTTNNKYYFAVNNGVIGPGAFVEPDGSWDLLNLKYQQPSNNSLLPTAVTLNYTLAFTELTPTVLPIETGSFTLHVDNVKTDDVGQIMQATSTYTSKNGYVKAQILSLETVAIDAPVNVFVPNGQPTLNDSVPVVKIVNDPSGFGSEKPLFNMANTKRSGKRNLINALMVFAVNSGLVDGNANNIKGAGQASLIVANLNKVQGWPCDDVVDLTIHYALNFTQI
jgi:hypothetical protein